MRQIQGKLVLLRISGEFELPRVRVIGAQLYRHRAQNGVIELTNNLIEAFKGRLPTGYLPTPLSYIWRIFQTKRAQINFGNTIDLEETHARHFIFAIFNRKHVQSNHLFFVYFIPLRTCHLSL